jgi:hypothetical protein
MMGDERQTEGSICDINVAYNSKRVGYTTSISYMNELSEIARTEGRKVKMLYAYN